MIPGPVEVSPAVQVAASGPPPGHLDPDLVAAFGEALRAMRRVWLAGENAASFAVPGGGTLAMEAAATNLVAPGERALVVSTGYFGDRMAEMLRRRGAAVEKLACAPGEAPSAEEAEAALARQPAKALFVTHVDTSTGVGVDPRPYLAAARRHGALSVVDGVCATAGERFEMEPGAPTSTSPRRRRRSACRPGSPSGSPRIARSRRAARSPRRRR
jgi:alanine-glyoxylate transaminase/serine-glyoxylate transaminase/serine-pyruvate transaminase